MPEKSPCCEENCAFFSVLLPEQKTENRTARQAISTGREFPGSLNTLCGPCVKKQIIDTCLDETANKLFKH